MSSAAVSSAGSAYAASGFGKLRVVEFRQRPVAGVRPGRRGGAPLRLGLGGPARLGDLGEVPAAVVRDQRRRARLALVQGDLRRPRLLVQVEPLPQQPTDVPEHPVDAGILELAGDRRVDRHVLVRGLEGQAVATPLLADVAQRVPAAAPVELVQHDHVGEVEHVDLLELAGRAVVRGHHVDRKVHQVDDLAVALADAGGLHEDHGEPGRLQQGDRVAQHLARGAVLPAGRHRAHEGALAAQAVHADAVAEQGAAGAPPGRVDRQQGDPHLKGGLRHGIEEAIQQFVGDAALARAASAGEAYDRHAGAGEAPLLAQPAQFGFVQRASLDRRQQPRELDVAAGVRRHPRPEPRLGGRRPALRVGPLDDVVDHRRQAHLQAVVGVVDPLDAVAFELRDLLRRDRAAAAAEHENVFPSLLRQPLDHVAEKLDVPALVGTDRDRVGVLLHGGADDLVDAAVVAQVDHLGPAVLDHAAHDVDGGVVPVEERGRGHEPERAGVLGGADPRILFGRRHGAVPGGLCRLEVYRRWVDPPGPVPRQAPHTGCAGAPAGFRGERAAKRRPPCLLVSSTNAIQAAPTAPTAPARRNLYRSSP